MLKEEVIDHLQKARKLVEDPRHWIKGRFKVKLNGDYGYCMLGALGEVSIDLKDTQVNAAAVYAISSAVQQKTRQETISEFNDSGQTTHEQMLQVFDLAIEMVRTSDTGIVL